MCISLIPLFQNLISLNLNNPTNTLSTREPVTYRVIDSLSYLFLLFNYIRPLSFLVFDLVQSSDLLFYFAFALYELSIIYLPSGIWHFPSHPSPVFYSLVLSSYFPFGSLSLCFYVLVFFIVLAQAAYPVSCDYAFHFLPPGHHAPLTYFLSCSK